MIIEQRDKQNINSKVFAISIMTAIYVINHYKVDAVRLKIANALELSFTYSFVLCSLSSILNLFPYFFVWGAICVKIEP